MYIIILKQLQLNFENNKKLLSFNFNDNFLNIYLDSDTGRWSEGNICLVGFKQT